MLRIILLIVALGTGVIAAWLAIHMQAPPTVVQGEPIAPALQDVLVASADLAPTQSLSSENIRWYPWPESAINPVYITRSVRPDALEKLAGSIVRNRMSLGEPIREANLASRDVGFLAAILPSGMRAVAVKISADNTAGGFILPKDRVDVLHTEGEYSRTILRNIPILAIDQLVDERSKDEKGKATFIGKTATLELDPKQAEILVAAQVKGTVSLSLRSVADNNDRRQSASTVNVIRAGRGEMAKTR
jgi:pilus assembly protein CpaB